MAIILYATGSQPIGEFCCSTQAVPPRSSACETAIAASYGLHQVLYATAVDQGYRDAQGVGLSPGGLFVPVTSLDLGTEYLANRFKASEVPEAATYADLGDLFLQFGPALRGFNAGGIRMTVAEVKTECAKPVTDQQNRFKYACGAVNGALAIQPGS